MNGLKLACRCGEEATYFIGDRHLCARCLAVLLDINVEEDMAQDDMVSDEKDTFTLSRWASFA
jgi:hypothetical protein